MTSLPVEIVEQILLKLPIKTLCRFKCVCKPWRKLITHPQFTKTHLSLSTHRTLLFLNSTSLYSVSPESPPPPDQVDNPNAVVKLEFPPFDAHNLSFHIVGSHNGVICLRDKHNTLFLVNPSTREWKKLPDPVESHSQFTIYGFGFDSYIDDYKLVVGFCEDIKFRNFVVRVFSLKTNAWKTVQDFHRHSLLTDYGVHVNGTLYWVSNSVDFDGHNGFPPKVITSFDLADEVFVEMPLPDVGLQRARFRLGSLEGSLCLAHDGDERCSQFWILKDSWVKMFRTPLGLPFKLFPLYVMMNGKILMQVIRLNLVIYDPKHETFERFWVMGQLMEWKSIVYVESLVSPNGRSIGEE